MTNQIHAAIIAAMREAAAEGIGKNKSASLGGANVKYRGIDDAMNTMVAILVRNGIIVTAKYAAPSIQERIKGAPAEAKAVRFAVVVGAFTFAAADGSTVVVECCGEAMDSGDKAVTKAQSVAFRTALFQTFVIPTRATAIDPEEDGDDDQPTGVEIPDAARNAAELGTSAYSAYWTSLTNAERRALFPNHEALKESAKAADKARGSDS